MHDLPSAVLFDMDGTLIDSEHLWLAAEIDVMAELGADWNEQDQQHCLGGPLERVAAYMVARSRTQRSSEDVGRLLLNTIEDHMRRAALMWRPGARDFLRATIDAGVPRALVTASWAVLVEALADRMLIEIGSDPFTCVVAGDHIVNSKPHPEPYLRAAELLGFSPSQCLAIEDSPTGVRSAAGAGCVVVAIPHIAPIPSDIAGVYEIDTLAGHSPQSLWRQALSNGG